MLFNLIIIVMYFVFYINFFLMFIFIPSIGLYIVYPIKSIQYFVIIKNIVINSIGFITKILLFPNIYVNSNNILTKYNINNKNLIISNHPSELDFLLSFIFYNNCNLINKNICLVKKMIGYQIPIIGFFGLLSGDVFLQRNINNDINKLNKELNFNFMLLFPEGTCFNYNKKLISDNYCDKNNLMKFKFHLYPRTTGFELIINNNKNINYIYDLTIIYDEIIKNNYGDHYNIINYLLNKFKISNKVFIQITKYKINRKKSFNKNIIENIFLTKDNFIKKFDIINNNFIPIKYNYNKGFGCFIIINLICIISIYLYIKYYFIRYLYFFQFLIYYLYFFIIV